MQLFKAFLKIARKRLPTISIYFIIYAVITFLLGSTTQTDIDSRFQSKSLSLCILDEDVSGASAALKDYLGSMHRLVELENDPGTLQDHLYYRSIDYILTIPAGFEENLKNGETTDLLQNVKIPGSATGYFVDQQVDQYLKTLQIYMAGGYSLEEAIYETDLALPKEPSVNNLTFQEDNLAARKEVFYFYRYHPYIFIVLLLCGMAPIVILFNRKELSERTACSSLSLMSHNLQLALGCVFYSLVTWAGFLFLGVLAYRQDFFEDNSLYAMLNSFVFLLIAAALTLFVSNFAPGDNALNMISNIIGLGMSFLCGVFVEQSLLSKQVLGIARFLPAYWYSRANDMLGGFSTEPFDLHFYWTAIGIQLLFAVAGFTAALAVSRIRRQRS